LLDAGIEETNYLKSSEPISGYWVFLFATPDEQEDNDYVKEE